MYFFLEYKRVITWFEFKFSGLARLGLPAIVRCTFNYESSSYLSIPFETNQTRGRMSTELVQAHLSINVLLIVSIQLVHYIVSFCSLKNTNVTGRNIRKKTYLQSLDKNIFLTFPARDLKTVMWFRFYLQINSYLLTTTFRLPFDFKTTVIF